MQFHDKISLNCPSFLPQIKTIKQAPNGHRAENYELHDILFNYNIKAHKFKFKTMLKFNTVGT